MTGLANPDPRSVEEQIEALYRRRYGWFLRVAVALLHDRELARDAVQETFARGMRDRGELRLGSVEPWLYRVLVNHCKNLNRDGRRRPVPSDNDQPGGAPSDDWVELKETVAALPERQRLVLFLRHYADLEYSQIAAALDIAPGTVAATLHAAHAAIRATVKEGAA